MTAPDLTPEQRDESLSAWRDNREPRWYLDIGYALQDVLERHRYEIHKKGAKPDDPGWHECCCGWEGYWCDFHSHVADHQRAVVARMPADVRAALAQATTPRDAENARG